MDDFEFGLLTGCMGGLSIGKICFPKEFIGKKIRIKIELKGDKEWKYDNLEQKLQKAEKTL